MWSVPYFLVWNENWDDAAIDAAAMCIPGVPAGITKLRKVSPNVKKVLDAIEENNYKFKSNPNKVETKQEVNGTIDFGDGTSVNVRVESHPLKQNGPDVRHANVEVTRKAKNKNKVIRNKHITD